MATIESMEQALHGRAAQMYLMTKLSLGLLTIPVLIASGLARVPWLRLFAVSVVVEPLWNGLLVLAGYRLGDSVAHMERGLRIVAIVGSVLVFLVLLLLYRRMFARLFQMIKDDPSPDPSPAAKTDTEADA
jgi:membrane protein DedA with SNARE-associated domain